MTDQPESSGDRTATLTDRHVSDYLLDKIEDAVAAAVRQVRGGKIAEATVTVTFKVHKDKDGVDLVDYSHKSTKTEKAQWLATLGPRLPLEN